MLSPLFSAILDGCTVKMQKIVHDDPEAATRAVMDGKFTALHLSVMENRFTVFKILLNGLLAVSGDVNMQNDYGATPLLVAVGTCPKAVPLLLDAGADPNVAHNDGFTPLSTAILLPGIAVVRKLLMAGADPNTKVNGKTPLITAVSLNIDETAHTMDTLSSVVEALLAAGADATAVDNDGKTAHAWATEKGYKYIALLLSRHTSRTDDGEPPAKIRRTAE
jgi:ankyrin repeat protein